MFVLLYTDLSIYLLETLSLSLTCIYTNKQTDMKLHIHTTHLCTPSASCIMPYAVCTHTPTHTHMHTVPKYGTCNIMHVCVSGLLDSVSGWEQGTSGGKKGKRKKKDANASAAAYCTVLHCTALHCTVCTARSRCRLASSRLASHCIASLRPVKLIPTLLLLPSAGQSPRRLLTLHYLYVA